MLITRSSFKNHIRECDGICILCGAIAWQAAETDAENRYCCECENRSVVAMNKALTLGIIQILEDK
jgi:hypothetical protein